MIARSVTLSGDGQIAQIGRRSVEEEERKKKKLGRRVIWVMGAAVGAARAWLAGGVCSLFLLSPSLSLFVCEGWKSFEGKIETEIDFRLERGILQSKLKLISIEPIFLCLLNTYRSVN